METRKQQPKDDATKKNDTVAVGANGVQMKRFEQVVATLLRHPIEPSYAQLPPVPSAAAEATEEGWPFRCLPPTARVYGNALGQLSNLKRARRKEEQIRSMLRCIFALLPEDTTSVISYGSPPDSQNDASTRLDKDPFTIVDFGGGSGHLGIPLALLLPDCRVVVVDLSERALALMRSKAGLCCATSATNSLSLSSASCETNDSVEIPAETSKLPRAQRSDTRPRLQVCAGVPNLFCFHGSVDEFQSDFDMAVALHLCGEATDVVLRLAGRKKAQSCIVAPCCVGKLSGDNKNPYIYQATGMNKPTISYPQSSTFCEVIGKTSSRNKDETSSGDWNALAKAADYSCMDESRTSRNAARRTAKALLETDRRFFLEESYGYQTALVRMDPWEATPKNDILLAWRYPDTESPGLRPRALYSFLSTPDGACQIDIQQTRQHLLAMELSNTYQDETMGSRKDGVDWTWEEEEEIRKRLCSFRVDLKQDPDRVLIFPTRLGGRRRKLVHYVAAQMKLAHWSEGKKDSEKTVAVALRRNQAKQ